MGMGPRAMDRGQGGTGELQLRDIAVLSFFSLRLPLRLAESLVEKRVDDQEGSQSLRVRKGLSASPELARRDFVKLVSRSIFTWLWRLDRFLSFLITKSVVLRGC